MSNLVHIGAIAAELLRFRQKYKMAAVRHLGLLFATLDHPRRLLVGRKRVFKFHINRYRHLKISQIWLKTPIPGPKIFVFWGLLTPKH